MYLKIIIFILANLKCSRLFLIILMEIGTSESKKRSIVGQIYKIDRKGVFCSCKTKFSFEYLCQLINFFHIRLKNKSNMIEYNVIKLLCQKFHEFLTCSYFLTTKYLTFVRYQVLPLILSQ